MSQLTVATTAVARGGSQEGGVTPNPTT
ncbi:hypothetical protein A2U01_0045604, partial [Trifolium medium]|nr:hypothetical protein [Trifolium medium]